MPALFEAVLFGFFLELLLLLSLLEPVVFNVGLFGFDAAPFLSCLTAFGGILADDVKKPREEPK